MKNVLFSSFITEETGKIILSLKETPKYHPYIIQSGMCN